MRHAWPLGYSGYGGVAISGVQPGSATVAGLPSVSAQRMAVVGRQKAKSNLARQQEMAASAPDALRTANVRALRTMSRPCRVTRTRTPAWDWTGMLSRPEQRVLGLLGACRAGRRAEVVDLLEVARVAPAGQGIRPVQRDLRLGAQHQRPDEAHPHHGKRRQGRRRGPRHPGVRARVHAMLGSLRPSPWRSSSIRAAAASPTAMPRSLARPSGIKASEVW